MRGGEQKQFEGLIALVTGGSRGIGCAICLAVAKEGATVAVIHHTSEAARYVNGPALLVDGGLFVNLQ